MPSNGETGLLARVVRTAATAATIDTMLDGCAQLLLDRADWVLADRLEDPDLIVRVAAYGRDGSMSTGYGQREAPPRRSSAGSLGLLPRALAAPRQMLQLTRTELDELAGDPQSYQARQAAGAIALGTTELLIIAMSRHDQPLGVLTLGRHGRGFGDAEIAELLDVASHLAAVLDAERLRSTRVAVATALQNQLLPPVPVVPGLHLAARYRPATRSLDVGGDWYDAFAAADGVTVVVGDATGHDVIAAAQMAELRNMLRAFATLGTASPAGLLSQLDAATRLLDLEAMATCLVGRLIRQATGWQLVWSNAGHPPPVVVQAGVARLLETPADVMLGVDGDPAGSHDRRDHSITLAPGDLLVLFTDGLVELPTEAISDRLELLRAAVEADQAQPPDRLADTLLTTFAAAGLDDVALLVVRFGEPA